MELAKVTAKGQITIPIAVRRKLGVKTGGKIMFLEDGDRVVIVNPSVQALLELQNDFAGVAEKLGIENECDVVALVKEVRQERAPKSGAGSVENV